MLKKFTNKDKRTDLDKEIDEIKIVLDKMKSKLDESNSKGLDDQIDSLQTSMSQVDAASEDYMNMAKALDILYKAKASIKTKLEEYDMMSDKYKALCEIKEKREERKKEIKKVLIVSAVQLIGLVAVVKHEDINVITGKAFGLIPWVKQ